MQIDIAAAEAAPGAVADPPLRARPWLRALDNGLGHLVEIPAALLVVAEIAVLLSGVVSRYLLHAPLVWSDELAGILFLWLAMLGAVVAFRRAEHMRMTALVAMAGPRTRAFLDTVALVAGLIFVALVLHPAYEFASEEIFVQTPALELNNAWRAAALPVGFGLMLAIALIRLAETADWRLTAGALALGIGVAAGVTALQPVLSGLGNINLLLFFVLGVGALVFSGVPIAFAFGLSTFAYITLTTNAPSMVVVGRMDEGMSHLILLAVPLFVFLGLLIEMTGMARAMVGFLASLLGHVRGGLSYVLVGAMYLVSGISGSKAADMAAVAPVLFPEMKARGAKEGDLVALLSATGAQTETIPPSIVLITIGSVTGVSITALFTGGLMPGLVLAVTLCALVWWRYRGEDLSHVARPSGRVIGKTFLVALPALALPFVIRFAVVEGIATATEVSTIGIVYAVLAGLLIYRQFAWGRLYPMLVMTATLSGAILLIIGAATGMAWALTQSGFSQTLASAMTSLPGGALGFLFVSAVAFVILGSVLEGIPAIVLFGPLLFPIARTVGVHEVHYAMVVILAMGVGLFAPPFGVGYYAACAISRIHPDAGMRPIVGYILALLVGLLVIILVPWFSIGFL
ncbi:TRAP transporter large permease subunit [Methylobacterium sp. NEAU 140]|uniref:TRAP transporter large permease n=2 Tax=Methylobacterium sp. NEAU 140 TaxID=3064945 RepID=UPI002736FDE0|nr:TRAP transporter large permease subunit [Methylobacterium sp. NEAU 140]MDP4025252.1 TRAP transporter large permease subunit [Methylobacterium sp. NEAU 140]MDP4025519.1 TRAP transporter large permease subunit [Methylobacterium sp. NEAU 140]MDP4027057.1 TRAP transporter large permease subunit [Methylobacterium sp. NEAU 140]